MGLRTPEQYKQAMRDGRAVYFRGEKVADVTTHPVIGIAVEHACIDYQMAEDPKYRDLAVIKEGGQRIQPLLPFAAQQRRPAEAQRTDRGLDARGRDAGRADQGDRHRRAARTASDRRENGGGGQAGISRADAEVSSPLPRQRSGDRGRADRRQRRPLARTHAQDHPDYYVRVVEERPDGIVVRGAKVHTSVSTNTDEVIVLPTRAMRAEDKAYAVAFALPINTPGLKLIASPHGSARKTLRASDQRAPQDDGNADGVRRRLRAQRAHLPNGEIDFAGLLALTFVRYHRFTAVSYKLPLLELMAGAGFAVAEANGVSRAAHVRDKLTHLAAYHTTVRGLIEHAAATCTIEEGYAVPNTLITNVAKYHFAHNYHQAVQIVQDLAGGLLVTAPAAEDMTSEATRDYVMKYMGGAKGFDAEKRLRLLNLIGDLTSSDFGGYQEVLAVHAEGGFEAEKLQAYREYDFKTVAAYARKLAGV